MNTIKKEGIAEATRWRNVVKEADNNKEQTKKVLMKPDKWEKICVRTEPDSKYFVRD